MLILSRRIGESVVLKFKGPDGEETKAQVFVIATNHTNQVKVGIQADKDKVEVFRSELLQ
jgi:carbon storage regulator CsrA